MLELKSSEESRTEAFRGQVKNLLGESTVVRAQKHEIAIQCKNLDEVTSKADICTALAEQFKIYDMQQASIVNLRKAYGGTQTANIRLPAEAARKLLDVEKVRIG